MADLTFVSRRDSSFKEFPPASAQIAMVLPFYGDLTVGPHPDAGGCISDERTRSGETILEVARRELWDSARSSRTGSCLVPSATSSQAAPHTCICASRSPVVVVPDPIGEVAEPAVPPAQADRFQAVGSARGRTSRQPHRPPLDPPPPRLTLLHYAIAACPRSQARDIGDPKGWNRTTKRRAVSGDPPGTSRLRKDGGERVAGRRAVAQPRQPHSA